MKSTSHLRKEVKRINWKNDTLNNLKQSPSALHLGNAQINLHQSIEALNLNAKAIENYINETLSTSVHVDQFSGVKSSANQMKRIPSLKRKLRLDTDFLQPSLALAFDSFDCNTPNYLSNQTQEDKNQHLFVSVRKDGDFKEFTSNNIISYLLFVPSTYLRATNEQLLQELVMEKLIQNSVKAFLVSQDPSFSKNFPIFDPLKLDFNSSLLSISNSPLKPLFHESPFIYAAQGVGSSLAKSQIKQDSQLSNNVIAKDTAKILADITLNSKYLKALLNDCSKPYKISFLVNQHIVAFNRKLNELESIAYGLMTSINIGFELHIQNFLVAFSKVYLLFHATITQKISKTLMESTCHKYFIDEVLKLRFQQNQITHLLGKMFISLKKTLMGYFKLNVEKEIKKNTFVLKTESLDKKQKQPKSYDNIDTVTSLLRNEHNKPFTHIFKSFVEIIAKVALTEKWRSLLPQHDLNALEAYQNMELLLKVNMIGAFLESITNVFINKKPQVNFSGIIVFTLHFFDIISTVFESTNEEARKKIQCILGIPEYNDFRSFIIVLIFLTSKDAKNPYVYNLGNVNTKIDYSWVKKVRSSNFNKPEGLTVEMMTKLLTPIPGKN